MEGKKIEKGILFLQEEYFYLQRTVESIDARALTIKSWSVTVSMLGIGAAYIQSIPVLLLLSVASALLFWIIESLWKTVQKAFYDASGRDREVA